MLSAGLAAGGEPGRTSLHSVRATRARRRGRPDDPDRPDPRPRRARPRRDVRRRRDGRAARRPGRPARPGRARPRAARPGRPRAAADAARGQHGAGHRGDRPRRRGRDRPGARRRRRRLRGQAVHARRSSTPAIRAVLRRGPDGGDARTRRSSSAGWRVDPRSRQRHARRRAGRADAARVRPAALPGRPARRRWSPSGSCSPRCGRCRTAARTRPSTCTCPGCAASWARPPRSPATCTPCAASGASEARRRPQPMRRRLALLVAAVDVVAACWSRSWCRWRCWSARSPRTGPRSGPPPARRALAAAWSAPPTRPTIRLAVEQVRAAESGRPVTRLPAGRHGARRPAARVPPAVALAARGQSLTADAGGRPRDRRRRCRAGRTAPRVIRIVVPQPS